MQKINEAEVDGQDNRNIKKWKEVLEHYNADMIVTDKGELVYASFIYVFLHNYKLMLNLDAYPEFGKGTKLMVNVLTREGLETCDFGKMDETRLVDLPTILMYENGTLLLSGIGLTLIEANMNNKKVIVKCDIENWPKGSTAGTLYKVHGSLSLSWEMPNNSYIIWGDMIAKIPAINYGPQIMKRTFGDYIWINADGSGYLEGSIKGYEKNNTTKFFKIDYEGRNLIFSWPYNNQIYWIEQDYSQKGWKNSGYSEQFLLKSCNRQGVIKEFALQDLDLNDTHFYNLSDNKIVGWQQNIEENKTKKQRFITIELAEENGD